MRVLALRRLAQLTVGQQLGVSRLLSLPARQGVFGGLRAGQQARRRALNVSASQASQAVAATEDKMATENGSTPVTAEEVEALRQQLEALQVRRPDQLASPTCAAACRRGRGTSCSVLLCRLRSTHPARQSHGPLAPLPSRRRSSRRRRSWMWWRRTRAPLAARS